MRKYGANSGYKVFLIFFIQLPLRVVKCNEINLKRGEIMGKLIFLAPLSLVILVFIGMVFFGDSGIDWLVVDSIAIIASAIFAGYFINFYKQNQSPLDFGFMILFFVTIINFVIGMILIDDYFWLFVDIYMIIVNILASIRFFVITR